MPETEVRVSEIKALQTKAGTTRFVLVDDRGNEYSTFKEQIASKLRGLEGKRARIKFHEQERDGFTNVCLDAVEPLDEPPAPYLLGADAERELSPRDLFAKLQPVKELVGEDVEKPDSGR
jgi:hypothetical protein